MDWASLNRKASLCWTCTNLFLERYERLKQQNIMNAGTRQIVQTLRKGEKDEDLFVHYGDRNIV